MNSEFRREIAAMAFEQGRAGKPVAMVAGADIDEAQAGAQSAPATQFDYYEFNPKTRVLSPVGNARPLRQKPPGHGKTVADQINFAGFRYDRMTDLVHLLSDGDEWLVADPQAEFEQSPSIAYSGTLRIIAKLHVQIQRYRKLGRERYPLFSSFYFAKLLAAYGAEQVTASWMEREQSLRAGLEL